MFRKVSETIILRETEIPAVLSFRQLNTHHVLEDERQCVPDVDDVVQGNDVGVLQLLQQAGLPDGGEGGALLLLQSDLLQSHRLLRQAAGVRSGQVRLPPPEAGSPSEPPSAASDCRRQVRSDQVRLPPPPEVGSPSAPPSAASGQFRSGQTPSSS